MKKLFLVLTTLFTFVANMNAMSYENAREQALFLTDKMAYELNLSPEQYDAAYEINLDYLMGVTTSDDVYSQYWECRNRDLSYVLLDWQYAAFCDALYFYRPLYWDAGFWHFRIYGRYPHRDWFYFDRPGCWLTYHGEHCWRHHAGPGYYHGRVFGTPATRNHSGVGRGIERGMRDNWNGQGRRFDNNSRGNSNRNGSNGGFNRNSDNNRGSNGGFNRNSNSNRGGSNGGRSFSGMSRTSQNSNYSTTTGLRNNNTVSSNSAPVRSTSGSATRSGSFGSSRSSGSSNGSSSFSSSRSNGSSSFGSSRSSGSSSFGGGSHSSSSHGGGSHGGGSFGGGGRR